MRRIVRIDVAAWLLALLAFAGASVALDRGVAEARDLLVVGQTSDGGGILPSAKSSTGERSTQFEERLKRLERASPSASDGQPALVAAPAGLPGGSGPAPSVMPADDAIAARPANAFDARAPPTAA